MTQKVTSWSATRIGWWAVLAAVTCVTFGPGFVRALVPPAGGIVDFYQEWASARNLLNGLPIYASQEITVQRYLGMQRLPPSNFFLDVNAHPPSSVLLAVPLAGLGYRTAFVVWTLTSLAALTGSLWIAARQLEIRLSVWSLLPAIALLLVCNPLQQQINQGQLNLILLLLVTGTWAADRSGKSWWAGGLLGTATAIKLFPGFLFLYFVLRRQWKSVAGGLLAFAGLTALTAAVLGFDAYRSYVQEVLPQVGQFRDWWLNASLVGFWFRLFDGASGHVEPILRLPQLAWAAALGSGGGVVLVLARIIPRAGSRPAVDSAFGAMVAAMLLVSPITWDHYLLLLLPLLASLWVHLPPAGIQRWGFRCLLLVVWLNPMMYWHVLLGTHSEIGSGVIARPWQSITALSLQLYALLGFFALGVAAARGQRSRVPLGEDEVLADRAAAAA